MKKSLNVTKLVSVLAIVAGACISIVSDITSEKLMKDEIKDEVEEAFANFIKDKESKE